MFSAITRAAAVVLAAVTAPALAGSPASAVAPSALPPANAQAAGYWAQETFDRMSQAQRIGQLFMVGNPAAQVDSTVLSDLANYHVGSVVLTGRSYSGTSATHAVTARLQQAATPLATLGAPLVVAADQEGGNVQTLQGPGFSAMPTALTQGSVAAATLRSDATTWGRQLATAGVNLNLAPVMDTVPVSIGTANLPIGYWYREFSHTPSGVSASGDAFVDGMRAAGTGVTVKHFPGLGRVAGNTDTSSGVTDYVTTYDDPYLAPFLSGIQHGASFVMMSTAYYRLIDANRPAAFSPTVIGGMLRGELGFRGVVISDDLGTAAQVRAWTPGQRAVDFIDAGGDVVLDVDPALIPQMVDAVAAAAQANAQFAAKVNAAALLVLTTKQGLGLKPNIFVSGDYTGARHSDIAVWRPSNSTWYLQGVAQIPWGVHGDVPVPANYDGKPWADTAVWRPWSGIWYIRDVANIQWGVPGDIPVPADYTGSGVAGLAVWRPSNGTWYLRGVATTRWGVPGDVPVPGYYDGKPWADTAVWRPWSGIWYIRDVANVQWGVPGDIPVPADYTGSGSTDIAVFRPSNDTWYIHGVGNVPWGQPGDIPVPGDYSGVGHAQLAVFRPSTGQWLIKDVATISYGVRGDIPVG